MVNKVYAILGATGKIGFPLTEKLLQLGHTVKAIGRDQGKLEALKEKGAQVFVVNDFEDANILSDIFQEVDAVFSFIPPGYTENDYGIYQDKVGKAIKAAIEKNDVRHVVNLSSIGADLADKIGPIKGLRRHETRLNSLHKTHVLHLRAGSFMENLFMSIPLIIKNGIFEGALFGHLRIPMVATKDIAEKAAYFLTRLDFKGHTVFDFVGPRAFTYTEAARILGKAIGKPGLKYVEFTYLDAEKAMVKSGIAPSTARLMMELYETINDGAIKPTQKITPEHQGTTTLEEFAASFVQVFKEME